MVVPAVAEIVREFASDRSRLMDIVLAVQRRFGYLSEDAMHAIATGVGMHLVEIQQMVSFYSFLERASSHAKSPRPSVSTCIGCRMPTVPWRWRAS
jgi:NADH:ubiquinone oxidoreductase subunit E